MGGEESIDSEPYGLIGDAFAQDEVLVLLNEVAAVTGGHGRRRRRNLGCGVNIRRRAGRRRRAGPARAAPSTAAPAGRVVVTANRARSGGRGGVMKDPLPDGHVGEATAVHGDPAAGRVIPGHHLGPHPHQRIFPV